MKVYIVHGGYGYGASIYGIFSERLLAEKRIKGLMEDLGLLLHKPISAIPQHTYGMAEIIVDNPDVDIFMYWE